jgi:surface antigen
MILRDVRAWPLVVAAVLGSWLAAFLPATAAAQTLPSAGQPEIYADLDSGDTKAATELMRRTLENEQSWRVANWKNGTSGRGGSITPVRTFRAENGVYCREYRESVASSKRVVAEIAVACRDSAEGWIRVVR